MNKDIFYKYDFYVLERIYPERKFVEFLEGISTLNESIIPFISNVVDLLHTSIRENKNIETTEIVLPNIDKELENKLSAYEEDPKTLSMMRKKRYDVVYQANKHKLEIKEETVKKYDIKMGEDGKYS